MSLKTAVARRIDKRRNGLDTEPLADQAYRQILLDIIECRLVPGERITEGDLAARLDIGKTPIGQALRRLVVENRMLVIPRHGYTVPPITLRDVREMFELRLLLEPALAERAATRITPADAKVLEKLIATASRLDGPDSIRRYFTANSEFHLRIAELTGNRRFVELLDHALSESQRMFNLVALRHSEREATDHTRLLEALDEHRRLLAALVARDPKRARKAAEEHVRGTRQAVIESMMSNGRFSDGSISE
jgi:DNA-binding GntR family transcriptional regulator